MTPLNRYTIEANYGGGDLPYKVWRCEWSADGSLYRSTLLAGFRLRHDRDDALPLIRRNELRSGFKPDAGLAQLGRVATVTQAIKDTQQ